jgi:hypothetical protein
VRSSGRVAPDLGADCDRFEGREQLEPASVDAWQAPVAG